MEDTKEPIATSDSSSQGETNQSQSQSAVFDSNLPPLTLPAEEEVTKGFDTSGLQHIRSSMFVDSDDEHKNKNDDENDESSGAFINLPAPPPSPWAEGRPRSKTYSGAKFFKTHNPLYQVPSRGNLKSKKGDPDSNNNNKTTSAEELGNKNVNDLTFPAHPHISFWIASYNVVFQLEAIVKELESEKDNSKFSLIMGLKELCKNIHENRDATELYRSISKQYAIFHRLKKEFPQFVIDKILRPIIINFSRIFDDDVPLQLLTLKQFTKSTGMEKFSYSKQTSTPFKDEKEITKLESELKELEELAKKFLEKLIKQENPIPLENKPENLLLRAVYAEKYNQPMSAKKITTLLPSKEPLPKWAKLRYEALLKKYPPSALVTNKVTPIIHNLKQNVISVFLKSLKNAKKDIKEKVRPLFLTLYFSIIDYYPDHFIFAQVMALIHSQGSLIKNLDEGIVFSKLCDIYTAYCESYGFNPNSINSWHPTYLFNANMKDWAPNMHEWDPNNFLSTSLIPPKTGQEPIQNLVHHLLPEKLKTVMNEKGNNIKLKDAYGSTYTSFNVLFIEQQDILKLQIHGKMKTSDEKSSNEIPLVVLELRLQNGKIKVTVSAGSFDNYQNCMKAIGLALPAIEGYSKNNEIMQFAECLQYAKDFRNPLDSEDVKILSPTVP